VNATAPAGFSPIVKLCFAGAAPPATAVNASEVGDAVSADVCVPEIVSVTGTNSGEFDIPVEETITCPL
jgi:hypothetical protein